MSDIFEPSEVTQILPTAHNSEIAKSIQLPPYLDGLNSEQIRAVQALDGPVLVLAGAGTGKTRVLTTRLALILFAGKARPWELLAVTFSF